MVYCQEKEKEKTFEYGERETPTHALEDGDLEIGAGFGEGVGTRQASRAGSDDDHIRDGTFLLCGPA